MKLLTLRDAAARLGVPEATLRYWIHRGTGPKSARIGRRRMFREQDLAEFVDHAFTSGDAA